MWLTKFYDKTLKDNHYIFAHFFLSMIVNAVLAVLLTNFVDQPVYRLKWHMRMLTFAVGVIYEVYQHYTGAEKGIRGSIEDIIMNQLACENVIGLYEF